MESYKEADRRAPPDERPAIASRLAWLAKETGHDFTARREFNRSRGAYATYTPLVTWILIGANVGVFAIDAVLGGMAGLGLMSGGGPLLDYGYVSADTVAAGGVVADPDQRLPPPGHPPSRAEHVGAVPVRPAPRAAVRTYRVPGHLPPVRGEDRS